MIVGGVRFLRVYTSIYVCVLNKLFNFYVIIFIILLITANISIKFFVSTMIKNVLVRIIRANNIRISGRFSLNKMSNYTKLFKHPVKGLLLDISGVLKDGDVPIPGSVEAIKTLQAKGIPFKLLTNETLKPQATIENTLNKLGFNITAKDMIHPVPFLKNILREEGLRPHLLLHPRMFAEFEGIDLNDPNCVVIGDAEEYFNYDSLNQCFRKLINMKKPILFSFGMGKYYMDDDGLALDVGAYCKGIEYATGVQARIVGKPSADYFLAGVKELGLKPSEVIMVGDDVEMDVGGAKACGMRGVLVRTGKYRKNDELNPSVESDAVVDNLQMFVKAVLKELGKL